VPASSTSPIPTARILDVTRVFFSTSGRRRLVCYLSAAAAMPNRLVALSLLAVYVVWSSTYLALRYVVAAMPALLFSGLRYALAGVLLLAIGRLSGTRWPTKAEWRAALPIGALLCVVGNGFVALAEREVGSGLAAMTCSAMPIFACLFEAAGGARPTMREWAGVTIGFCGVIALGLADLRRLPSAAILLALAPVGWALGSVWMRRLPRAPGAMAAATQLLCGGVLNTAIALVVGERWPEHPPASAWLAWLYLVLFGSVICFRAYNYLLTHTRTAVATSYAYVNPVIALLLGVSIADEKVSGSAMLAGVLVVAGVVLVVTAAGEPRRKTS
jgi:drug/metabolite transporter (DMT)-like permease